MQIPQRFRAFDAHLWRELTTPPAGSNLFAPWSTVHIAMSLVFHQITAVAERDATLQRSLQTLAPSRIPDHVFTFPGRWTPAVHTSQRGRALSATSAAEPLTPP